ncbi:MAG: hypothetical protein AABW73_04440 [Nanoarchaeota archaeon]
MMKKGETEKVIVLIVIAGILFIGLTGLATSEEGFFKSLRSFLTGKATSGTFNLNISVGNSPPNITNVGIVSTPFDPTEYSIGGGLTAVTFNFTVNDTDGYQNIDTTSAKANATFVNGSTVWVAKNDSCVYSSGSGQTAIFNCTLKMWYFNPAGLWNITIYAQDNSGASAQNRTQNFTYSSLKAFTLAPATLAFNSLSGGSTNTTSTNDPVILNNTGNYHFDPTTGNISVNATSLVGETNSAYSLYGGNFTVGTYGADSTVNCGNSTWSHFMSRSVFVNLTTTNSSLPYGNLSAGGGAGQGNLFVCLTLAGGEISSQAYSTNGPNSQGSWQVKVQT